MKNKYKGFTLTELLITIIVLAIMFGMIVTIVLLIKRNFLDVEKRAAMQQAAVVSLSKLTRELLESSVDSLTVYNYLDNSYPAGLVFASPRDPSPTENNRFKEDSITSKPVWNKFVCYYLDTDPEAPSEKALFRKEIDLSDVPGITVDPHNELDHVERIKAIPCPMTTEDFKNDSSLQTTILAHRVAYLTFQDLNLNTTYAPDDFTENMLPLKIGLELGEKEENGEYQYSISISFRMNMNN